MGEASRFRRLRGVGWSGIAARLRYRVSAPARARRQAMWTERYGVSGQCAVEEIGSLGGSGVPFFIRAHDGELADDFRARFPGSCRTLLEQADAVLSGDLSWVVPGGTSDWHRALPGADRWPIEPLETLAIAAEQPLGDVRLAWEVGRCAHLVRLAQAAWLTREPHYATAARAGIQGFMRQNPPGRGIGWLHAQEVALRAIAWLWVDRLLEGVEVPDPYSRSAMAGALRMHAEFVEAFPSDGPVTHNHLISEASALFLIGASVPGLPGASRWRRLGARLLWREVVKQIDEEGVSGEGSIHYHAFVLDSLIAVILLAETIGERVPAVVRDRVEGMADFVAWSIRSDGSLPPVGDTDAGRAWRLGTSPLDRRDVLAAAAVAFDRPDWGAISGDAPGAFFLTGGRPVPGAEDPAGPGGMRVFRSAGFAVGRTGFGEHAEVAWVRAGPTCFRTDVLTSHLHADALSLGLWVGGEEILLDPGTYLYSEGMGWRGHLRKTSSHSCVVLDGRDQADVTSERFGIGPVEPARWLEVEGDATGAVVEAEHPATGAPRVRRRVVWIPGGTLAVCDDVSGAGEHDVEVRFQLPDSRGEPDADGVELTLASGRRVRILALSGTRRISVDRGKEQPGAGWSAPRYGVLARGTSVALSAGRSELPRRLITVVQTVAAEAVFDPVVLEPDGSRIMLAGTAVPLPAAPGGLH